MQRGLKRLIYYILTRTSLVWQSSVDEYIWWIVHPLSQIQIALLVFMTLLSLCCLYPPQFPYHIIGLCLYLPILFLLAFNVRDAEDACWYISVSCWEVGSLTPKCTASFAWLRAPLVSLGFASDLNHYLHQGEALPTPLPVKGSLKKGFRDLNRWGEAHSRLDVSIYLPISPHYLVFWTHGCILPKYDKGIEISEIGCSYNLWK